MFRTCCPRAHSTRYGRRRKHTRRSDGLSFANCLEVDRKQTFVVAWCCGHMAIQHHGAMLAQHCVMAIYENHTIVPGRHVSITSAALARAASPEGHVLHSQPHHAISHFALCDHMFEIPEQSNSWRSDTFWKPAAGMSSACRCEHSQLPIRIL